MTCVCVCLYARRLQIMAELPLACYQVTQSSTYEAKYQSSHWSFSVAIWKKGCNPNAQEKETSGSTMSTIAGAMEHVGKEPVRPVRITHQSHMNVMKLSDLSDCPGITGIPTRNCCTTCPRAWTAWLFWTHRMKLSARWSRCSQPLPHGERSPALHQPLGPVFPQWP